MQRANEFLEAITTYQFGQSRKALDTVAAMAVAAAGTPRQQALANDLVALLAGNATIECKRFILRQLAVVGTEDQSDAIGRLLLDPDLSDMARYALQPIQGDKVDRVLLSALKQAPASAEEIQIGLMTTLGARGVQRAVRPLSKFAKGANPAVAGAAISALGRIGGSNAARALQSARAQGDPARNQQISEALLVVAVGLLASGDAAGARSIYDGLVLPGEPDAVRSAAIIGLAQSGGLQDEGSWRGRFDEDPVLRKAAAGYLHKVSARYEDAAERQMAR